MKTAIKKTKMITIALLSVFTMGFSQAALSNNGEQNPVELKAVGNINKQPLFELKLNNIESDEFLIKVKDGNGDLLYSETLKGKNLYRRYRLDINEEEFNAFHLRFEIKRIKTHETFVYNVTRNSRVVEDIIVAKL